jgi:hypothetical protein
MAWMDVRGIDGYVILSIIRVAQANADIWNLEHKLRNAADGDVPLAEAGKIAIKVREHNKTRIRYMNELDKAVGSEFVAEKINHLSEECYEKFYQQKRSDTV